MNKIVATLAILLLGVQVALALTNEPRGFGKARFGMSVAEVKKIFPAMKEMVNPKPEAAALLAVYKLENQSVYGLKPCIVRLQFDPEKLYQVSFDCGRDIKVTAALQKQLGNPTQTGENAAFWIGDKTTISLNITSKVFAFIDRALTAGFQSRLGEYVEAHRATGNMPPAESGPTPSATPP